MAHTAELDESVGTASRRAGPGDVRSDPSIAYVASAAEPGHRNGSQLNSE